jgi:hypothetical protein
MNLNKLEKLTPKVIGTIGVKNMIQKNIITEEDIEKGCKKAQEDDKHNVFVNTYFPNGFKAGVEFALSQLPKNIIEIELPANDAVFIQIEGVRYYREEYLIKLLSKHNGRV